MLMSIFAYAADCTATRAKARGPTFTILESLFGVGAVAGSFASGLLVTHIGLASTFWLAAALFGCSFLYIWTIPESLSADQPKAKSSLCKNNTITSLRVLVSPREHIRKQRWSVLLMSTTFFLVREACSAHQTSSPPDCVGSSLRCTWGCDPCWWCLANTSTAGETPP